jgi:2-polyprenyl-6-methoxyphenol hydroxylase-like FAD-dependent oxidoreductase
LLQRRLQSIGLGPEYRHTLAQDDALQGYDLVVAADGAHSTVRRALAPQFGTTIEPLHNRFAWYGTTQRFDSLSQTFIRTEHGCMNAHHYRYAPGTGLPGRPSGGHGLVPHAAAPVSTFIVECDAATWQRAGFEQMDDAQTRHCIEHAFATVLDGHALIGNKSVWRQFPKVSNRHWSVGNRVLVGDALRTAHFSIGSGTRLAFEDVIALARALREHGRDLPAALAAYEAARRPVVDKLVAAADRSADWYEHFAEHMQLEPWDLAWSYIQRSGRIDPLKLRQASPRFAAGYEAWAAASRGADNRG